MWPFIVILAARVIDREISTLACTRVALLPDQCVTIMMELNQHFSNMSPSETHRRKCNTSTQQYIDTQCSHLVQCSLCRIVVADLRYHIVYCCRGARHSRR